MSAQGRLAGRARVSLGVDDSELQKGLKSAQRRMQAFGSSMTAIGRDLAMVGGAITAPLLGAAKVFADTGDALDKMSARTKMSAEELSALSFVAKRSGSDMATVEKAALQIAQQMNEAGRGSKTALDAFRAIGRSAEELEGLNTDQRFRAIAESIAGIQDPVRRADASIQFFGKRSGAAILPVIENMKELRKEAEKRGLIVSTADAAQAAKLTDAFADLQAVVESVALVVGAALSPQLTRAFAVMERGVIAVREFIRANQNSVLAVAAVGVSLVTLGATFISLGLAFKAAAVALGGVAAALAVVTSPVALVVAGFAAIGSAAVKYTAIGKSAFESMREVFSVITGDLLTFVGAIRDGFAGGGIDGAVAVAMAGVNLQFAKAKDFITGIWRDITNYLAEAMDSAASDVVESLDYVLTMAGSMFPGVFKIASDVASKIAETFWTAIEGIVRGFAYLAKRIVDIGYALRIVNDDIVSLYTSIEKLEGAGAGFATRQRESASSFYESMREDADKSAEQRMQELNERTAQRERERAAAAKAREAGYKSESEAARQALLQARKEYEDAVKGAATIAAEAEISRVEEAARGISRAIPDIMDSSTRTTTQAAFGGSAVDRAFAAVGFDRAIEYQKTTAENTKRINDTLRQMEGGAFS